MTIKKSLFPPPEWWTKNGLPVPVTEYRFHPIRRWRFDYYFDKPTKLAIEIEGGAYLYGRHNRPKGFIRDMEKYNVAETMGIKILRYSSINKISVSQVKAVLYCQWRE